MLVSSTFFLTMFLTFKVAIITTFLLLLIAIPLSYFLAFSKSKIVPVMQTIVSMPLVLPPSVLGFYLLLLFSPQNALGSFLLKTFNLKLVFSFEGLIVASMIFSLPFMVNPIHAAFVAFPKSFFEAALTLGKSGWSMLFFVLLPNASRSIMAGVVIAFAHTIGEFGVVMMIGGNIEGVTRVASIAIYDEVEALNYDLAHQYALTLFVISFCILLLTFYLNRKALR
ncbi:MAG: molybdate ABC transporter permease subunit [Helicobacter sp.]|nr:molybdate ABC transporter permease subunit [Helicobacter sp.]